MSKIIYYNTVYQTELRFPSGSVEVQKAYLRSEIERISAFFQKNLSFYQYYRTKATYLDNKYFLRGKREQRKEIKNGYAGKPVRWTGTKRALVELIYALDTVGCLNKGTLDIKEIVAYFEEMLDIDLGDFYHCYMELKAKCAWTSRTEHDRLTYFISPQVGKPVAFYFPVRLNFAAKSIKVSDMDVITMESKAYKELDNKITAIADYIFNRLEAEKPNEDDMWVDSYEVCTFLKISEKTLQRLRVSGTIA